MARPIASLLIAFPLWFVMSGTVEAQTAVEAGLGAARAATTTAPAAGIGKSLHGLAGSLEKTVKTERQTVTRTTVHQRSDSAESAPAAAPKREDPSGIEAGLSYAELVRRFGPPAMEITGELGTSLTYSGKAGTFQLEVRDGKVACVEKPKS